MVLAPRPLAVAVLICRVLIVALSAAALASAFRAPDISFTALQFQKFALVVVLFWNMPRLLYDAVQVMVNVPLPPWRFVFTVLVVAEWVMMVMLFASGSSATAVLIFFQVDTRACESVRVHPGACSHWQGASATLTLWAWFLSALASVLLFWVRVGV